MNSETSVQAIDHVNIVVRDLPRMRWFYEQVMGMAVHKTATITGAWLDAVVGLADVKANVVILRLGDGSNLELIEYVNPVGERPDGAGDANAHGIRHLAFRVADIDAVVARCRREGVAFCSAVHEVPTTQVAFGASMRKRICYFHDPEGNLLELCAYEGS